MQLNIQAASYNSCTDLSLASLLVADHSMALAGQSSKSKVFRSGHAEVDVRRKHCKLESLTLHVT